MVVKSIGMLVPLVDGGGGSTTITLSGQVFLMLIFTIFAFAALGSKKVNSKWALLWAVLVGLVFASTTWGQATTDGLNWVLDQISQWTGRADAG
jgi:hypothetical protein